MSREKPKPTMYEFIDNTISPTQAGELHNELLSSLENTDTALYLFEDVNLTTNEFHNVINSHLQEVGLDTTYYDSINFYNFIPFTSEQNLLEYNPYNELEAAFQLYENEFDTNLSTFCKTTLLNFLTEYNNARNMQGLSTTAKLSLMQSKLGNLQTLLITENIPTNTFEGQLFWGSYNIANSSHNYWKDINYYPDEIENGLPIIAAIGLYIVEIDLNGFAVGSLWEAGYQQLLWDHKLDLKKIMYAGFDGAIQTSSLGAFKFRGKR